MSNTAPIQNAKAVPAGAGAAARLTARPGIVFTLLLILVCLAYLPAFRAGTVWDDDEYVTNNQNLRTAAGLVATWTDPHSTPQYYPVVHTMFWLEYRLWGVRPAGYHAVNILLHALDAFLFWLVLRRLKVPGALAAALIFAVHPIEVESVAWITEGKNTLSLALGLLALLAYLRFDDLEATEGGGRRWGWYAAALLLFSAAVLSKTVTATLVGVLGVLIWWKRGRVRLRDVAPLLPMLIVGAALGLNTARLETVRVGAIGRDWDFTWVDRCLIAGRVVWFYAGKLVFPADLAFMYERWRINAASPVQYVAPLAVVGVLVGLWLARGRIGRGPLAGALCFVGMLFPALGFVNVYPMRFSFVADHFQYHAGLALLTLLAVGGALVLRRAPRELQRRALMLGVVAMFGLVVVTFMQCTAYHDGITLWVDTINKSPRATIAYLNLADVASQNGDAKRAVAYMEEAAANNPEDPKAWAGLGAMLSRSGGQEALRKAVGAYGEAIKIYRKPEPELAGDEVAIGRVLLQLDRPAEAAPYLRAATESRYITAETASAYELYGTALMEAGRSGEAVAPLREGLKLRQGSASLNVSLAAALWTSDQQEEAIAVLRRAARAIPDSLLVREVLAMRLATRPGFTPAEAREAVAAAEQACAMVAKPDAGLLDTLAVAQASAGRFEEAARTAERAAEQARSSGQGGAAQMFAGHAELFRQGKMFRPGGSGG